MGQMIIELPENKDDADKIVNYLISKEIKYEEVR